MGFLTLFKPKRDKIDLGMDDELDMPPIPPKLEDMPKLKSDFGDDMGMEEYKEPQDVSFPNMNSLPRFDKPTSDQIPIPNFDLPKTENTTITKNVPFDYGMHQDFGEEHKIQTPVQYQDAPKFISKPYPTFVKEGSANPVVSEKKQEGSYEYSAEPLYMHITTFKQIIENLNQVRIDLKRSEDEINILLDVKGNEEREFERWRCCFEGIQKKLMLADEILFKG